MRTHKWVWGHCGVWSFPLEYWPQSCMAENRPMADGSAHNSKIGYSPTMKKQSIKYTMLLMGIEIR